MRPEHVGRGRSLLDMLNTYPYGDDVTYDEMVRAARIVAAAPDLLEMLHELQDSWHDLDCEDFSNRELTFDKA